MKLNKYSRAGKNGTEIRCPNCQTDNTVYHMAWSAITCQNCRSMIDKYHWRKIKHKKAALAAQHKFMALRDPE